MCVVIYYKATFMKVFFLSLGTNLGDKRYNIYQAVLLIGMRVGRIVSSSGSCETAPDGFASENSFLNAVVAVESRLSPLELLAVTQQIERDLGSEAHRNADGSYRDRVIDIDIVACGDEVFENDVLQIPHPRMHLRRFVLEPLCRIAPDWRHPLLQKTAQELCGELL